MKKCIFSIFLFAIMLCSFSNTIKAHTLTESQYSNNSSYINNFTQSGAIQTPWSFSSGRAHINTRNISFRVEMSSTNSEIYNAMLAFIRDNVAEKYNIDTLTFSHTTSSSALITYYVNMDTSDLTEIYIKSRSADSSGNISSVKVNIPYYYARKVAIYESLGGDDVLQEAANAMCHATGLACGLGTYNNRNCNMNSSNFASYSPQFGDRAGMRVVTGYHKHTQTKVYDADYFYSISSTKHRRYCSNCKLTQSQDHHFAVTAYTKIDSTQHKCTNKCSDCQYTYYSYEGHSFRSLSNNNYSCIGCGYTTSNPGGNIS